ncbi:MAG: hypothetical protein APF80_02470 [Alphaproteobacteria bacterium BRH_c36]|nr:MAG: hypothetical protein APF80_02470 [Alphaproteobacteria bacterium BRH_c36]
MLKHLSLFAVVAAVAAGPMIATTATAQDKKAANYGKDTVAGYPTLPTKLDALLEMRETWGDEPSKSSSSSASNSAASGSSASKK